MAPDSKLPEREIAICRRLLEIRQLVGLDQKGLGAALGLTRDRIASYENLRAPVRYDLGDKICSSFDLNQRWLATGQLPQLQYQELADSFSEEIPPRALFSEAYDKYLADFVTRSVEEIPFVYYRDAQGRPGRLVPFEEIDFHLVSNHEWKIRRSPNRPKIDPTALLPSLLATHIRKAFEELSPELRSKFYRHVGRAVFAFMKESRGEKMD